MPLCAVSTIADHVVVYNRHASFPYIGTMRRIQAQIKWKAASQVRWLLRFPRAWREPAAFRFKMVQRAKIARRAAPAIDKPNSIELVAKAYDETVIREGAGHFKKDRRRS